MALSRLLAPGCTPVASLRSGVTALLALALFVLVLGAVPAHAATGTLNLAPTKGAVVPLNEAYLDGQSGASFTAPSSSSRPTYLALQVRSTGAASGYRAKLTIMSDGHLRVGFTRVSGNAETAIGSTAFVGQVTAGQKVNLQSSVTGTSTVSISVRAWVEGASKPGWQLTTTDSSSSRIASSGSVYAWGYLSKASQSSASIAVGPVHVVGITTGTAPPTSSTPGVVAGTSLTKYTGTMYVTNPGTVIQNVDVTGYIVVRANNVTIRNSFFHGGPVTREGGIITNLDNTGLVMDHITVKPDAQYKSYMMQGIKGKGFTLTNSLIDGGTDNMQILGDNVTVRNNVLKNADWWAHDPNQGGGPSHSDGIQVIFGRNLVIDSNEITNAPNFAIMSGAEHGDVTITVKNNYLDGGHCTTKFQVKNGYSQSATLTSNRFGPNRVVRNCAIVRHPAVTMSASGNVYTATGGAVAITVYED